MPVTQGCVLCISRISPGVVKNLKIDEVFAGLPKDREENTSPSTLFQMFLLWEYHVAMMDRKSFGQIGTENMHYLRLSIATGLMT